MSHYSLTGNLTTIFCWICYTKVFFKCCSSVLVKCPVSAWQWHLSGLHRARVTSTPSSIFWMNWKTDCESGLIAQHQPRYHSCCSGWMRACPCRQIPKPCGRFSEKSGGRYSWILTERFFLTRCSTISRAFNWQVWFHILTHDIIFSNEGWH